VAAGTIAEEVLALLDEIWDGECECSPDTSILAARVGALLTDEADTFLDRLEEAARAPDPVTWDLRSESPEVRRATLDRLDRLRREPALAARYREALSRLWSVAGEEWEHVGRRTVLRACRRWTDQLARGTRPIDLLPEKHLLRKPRFAWLLQERPRLVLTPLYFAPRQSGYVIDMTDYLHVGAAAESGGQERLDRGESEQLASRVKVLSDGTRVALLRQMVREPLTVMDLARRFGLAQPTVSNHVRLLREAGLLESQREGARVLYQAPPDRVSRLLDETRHVLLEA
jgi:DNA-binding transcriptional ArsR family regulator